MKILLVLASADVSIADVSRGYFNALRRAGHDVRAMALNKWIKYHTGRMDDHEGQDAALDLRRHTAVLQLASEKTVIDAMRHQAELVIVVSGMAFHPDGLALLRAGGFKTALVCTESPYDDEEQQYLANLCDMVTVNDRASMAKLTHPNLHYLPAAYDPAVHIPPGCVGPEYASDVFFVGTGFTERKELFEASDWTGIDLRIYGYWPTVNAYSPIMRYIAPTALHNSEAVRWYGGTKVGINLHRDGAGWSANPRVFELAAVGTHQVVDSRRPEVRELLGDSACYFDGAYDFEDRVRACLADPEHRRKSAAEAMERIQGQTFDARVSDLLSWL